MRYRERKREREWRLTVVDVERLVQIDSVIYSIFSVWNEIREVWGACSSAKSKRIAHTKQIPKTEKPKIWKVMRRRMRLHWKWRIGNNLSRNATIFDSIEAAKTIDEPHIHLCTPTLCLWLLFAAHHFSTYTCAHNTYHTHTHRPALCTQINIFVQNLPLETQAHSTRSHKHANEISSWNNERVYCKPHGINGLSLCLSASFYACRTLGRHVAFNNSNDSAITQNRTIFFASSSLHNSVESKIQLIFGQRTDRMCLLLIFIFSFFFLFWLWHSPHLIISFYDICDRRSWNWTTAKKTNRTRRRRRRRRNRKMNSIDW